MEVAAETDISEMIPRGPPVRAVLDQLCLDFVDGLRLLGQAVAKHARDATIHEAEFTMPGHGIAPLERHRSVG